MKRLLMAIVLLAAAGVGTGWWWARGSVPSLDTAWTLAGLHGPVEVVSDAHGVPHVYARDTDDAWFAAGALHARDRLWQMELYRRASLGRLAEALGEPALAIDRRMLTLRIRAAAEAEFARLGGPARTALTRYAEGVNAADGRPAGPAPSPRTAAARHHARPLDAAGFAGGGAAAGLPAGRERQRRTGASRARARRGRSPC